MSATTEKLPIAPGARVTARDEEWIVRSVKAESKGVDAVTVIGISELVRGREAIFLTDLDDVEVLRPEETQLVEDESSTYRKSRLYLESLLRRTPPTDNKIHLGHQAAIDTVDYQLEPAAQALSQLRPRILMADGVGLGKTVEVGILLTELMRRGKGRRILVVAMKSILEQFQEELWARFTIPLVRLDSVGIQRVQSKIPSNMNPFHYFDRVIISIDTLKNAGKYRQYLEQCHWDCIVVDECQHIAMRTKTKTGGGSQRAALGNLLSQTCDSLILTSATPHDGSAKSFASLMRLLEPTAIADEENFTRKDVDHLFLRRFKKDVKHQLSEVFPEREEETIRVAASAEEDAFFDTIQDAEFQTIAAKRGKKGGGAVLFRTTLLKAFLSSPAACISTLNERLGHKKMNVDELEGDELKRALADKQTLEHLRDLAEAVSVPKFSKYGKLLSTLREYGVKGKVPSDRVVIFSERIQTLDYLEEHLLEDLKLKPAQIAKFHGTLQDQDQMALVKDFGTESSKVRILLASDAAAEGINLHYYSHRLIQFDLPWSLITMVQRNGRIDRFGQKNTPYIHYLLTESSSPETQADLRVLERLIAKEAQVTKNLGDAACLMNLHETAEEQEISIVAAEEQDVALAIQGDLSAEEVLPDEPKQQADGEDPDWFLDVFGGSSEDESIDVTPAETTSLFNDDLAFAHEAFEEAVDGAGNYVRRLDNQKGFEIAPPDDLKQRYEYLPSELLKKRDRFKLTIDRQLVMDGLEKAREDDAKWPEWELMWSQHPVCEWLDDQVLAAFGRHEAPVLRINRGLEPGTSAFLFQGIYSNKRSQPVIVKWFAIPFAGSEPGEALTFEELRDRTGLGSAPSNPTGCLSDDQRAQLEGLRESASIAAKAHMVDQRQQRAAAMRTAIADNLRSLKTWGDARIALLEEEKYTKSKGGKLVSSQGRKRAEQDIQRTKDLLEQRREWIQHGFMTAPEPYLRLAAVFTSSAS
jgi:SNF2 family DNA or RNA helicase